MEIPGMRGCIAQITYNSRDFTAPDHQHAGDAVVFLYLLAPRRHPNYIRLSGSAVQGPLENTENRQKN